MVTPIRVLIVEDSPEDAELLLAELRHGGYAPTYERVQTAEAMAAALSSLKWDIVISDYSMPKFSAPAALELLQRSGLDLPFIIVSGTIGEDIAVSAMKAGAHDYIMKGHLKRLPPAIERELREAAVRLEHKQAEEHLRQSEERFRQLAENISEVLFMTNPDATSMIYVSPAYETIWDRSCQSLYDNPLSWLESVHSEDHGRVEALLRKDPQRFQTEYRVIRPDGTVRWIWARTFQIRDQKGIVYGLEGIAQDITERKLTELAYKELLQEVDVRKQAEATIQRMAYNDTLTELPNRNMLYDRLLNAIRTDSGQGKPMAILLMDLDHFKEINDTLGHQRGDLLLKEVGLRLKTTLFEPDMVARLGGDEFVILLPRLANTGDIKLVIQKIQGALEVPFVIENMPIHIEASIGIALYPDHGTSADVLLQRADVAMYAAKGSGSGYTIYSPEQDKLSPRRLSLMGELRHAIEKDQLFLHYQPKISFKTNRVIGVEALVRWQHPEYGFVPPDQFILPAEKTGLIHPLTRWVLKTAMRQCQAWRQAGLNLPVAVNLSARNLHDPQLRDHLAGLLKTTGATAEQLELEITESAIMANPQSALEIITHLKTMGIRFALDDFGIGYSSLAYLKKLPVDTIKIDKSFVIDVARDEDDVLIVLSTINLAHNLGLKVVAEGVETKDVWDRLSAFGCDAAQGYYMCKPLPVDDLTRWLKESPWGMKQVPVYNPSV
jgi:diguanylate cyclase (GGDEF)-like protein/PAS domain S-box-containing protein